MPVFVQVPVWRFSSAFGHWRRQNINVKIVQLPPSRLARVAADVEDVTSNICLQSASRVWWSKCETGFSYWTHRFYCSETKWTDVKESELHSFCFRSCWIIWKWKQNMRSPSFSWGFSWLGFLLPWTVICKQKCCKILTSVSATISTTVEKWEDETVL